MQETNKIREIDVIGIIMKLLPKWMFIAKVMAVSGVIGAIVALNTSKEYTTDVILAPEMSSGGIGLSESLSDMAASFGIELGNKGQLDALYPEIYPSIFSSTDFILTLFDIPVKQEKDSISKSYKAHLLSDAKTPFWKYPIVLIHKLFKEKEQDSGKINPFKLSRTDEELCELIRGSIGCKIDKKTNIINLSVTDFDRHVSAIMADTLLHRLQNYITAYRTSKARHDLSYYEQLCNQAKKEYTESQHKYASFSDSHLNTKLQITNSKIEELENDVQLKYQAFAQTEQQVRAAKARVQERTPAFTIIQNATIPNKASSTPRSLIVLLYMFLGCMGACFWVIFGNHLKKTFKQYKMN